METGLSLGSNLGNCMDNLLLAKEKILAIPEIEIIAESSIYETEPVDVAPEFQDKKFLNMVLIVETDLDHKDLFRNLHAVEEEIGRIRGEKNIPRLIDIDVIYMGNKVVSEGIVRVPHVRWAERRFVVEPLAEVRPDLVIPGQTVSVKEILESLPKKPGVRKL